MPRVGFEPTIPVFERAKAVHATVIGLLHMLHSAKSDVATNIKRRVPTVVAVACLKVQDPAYDRMKIFLFQAGL
jgi:hypothetical protein